MINCHERQVGVKNVSPLPTLPFKIGVTKWFRNNTNVRNVWQRNYYEHIIRNEKSLNRIRQYILDNPTRWAFDRENPTATTPEPEDAWARLR